MEDHDLLIRIDEKMDSVIQWQEVHMAQCHQDHTRYEKDLSELKEWKWKVAGALCVLVFLLNFIGYQTLIRTTARELVRTVEEFPRGNKGIVTQGRLPE